MANQAKSSNSRREKKKKEEETKLKQAVAELKLPQDIKDQLLKLLIKEHNRKSSKKRPQAKPR